MKEPYFLLDHVSDAVLIHKGLHHTLFVNRSCVDMLDLSDVNATLEHLNNSDDFFKKISKNNIDTLEPFNQDDLDNPDSNFFHNEFILEKSNGDSIWISSNTETIDWQGETAYFTSFKDISTQRKAEQAKKVSQSLLEETLNLLPCAVTVTEFKEGRYVYANDFMLNLMGYTKEEMIGTTALDLDIWADTKDRDEVIAELRSMGSIYDHRQYHKAKDGTLISTSFNAHVIQSQETPLLIAASFDRRDADAKDRDLDKSYQKLEKAEQAAKENHIFLASVLNNIGQGVLVYDRDLNIVAWNELYVEMLGYPRNMFKKGMNISEILLRDARVGLYGKGDINCLAKDRLNIILEGLKGGTFELDWALTNEMIVKLCARYLPDGSLVVTAEDVSEQRRRSSKIRSEAYCDSLTGIANRRAYDVELPESLQKASDNNSGVILGLLDLDNFKNINDTLGHAVGDAVLVEVARIIRHNIRSTDLAVRLGGDEFAVIFNDTQDENIAKVRLETIVNRVFSLDSVDGTSIQLSSSAGMSLSMGGLIDAQNLFVQADEALYTAKKAGKGCVRVGMS